MSTKNAAAAKAAPEATSTKAPITVSKIVHAAPRRYRAPNPRPGQENKLTPKERGLAGRYRMIHGTAMVPRPVASFTLPDGTIDLFAKRWDEAGIHQLDNGTWIGDEVDLTDEDAATLMDNDQIEPIDAKPSRCGKVFAPPKVVANYAGISQGIPEHASSSKA